MRALVLYFGPAVMIVLGLPLLLSWVPPNAFYGFRTARTLASPETWYSVNRATGIGLVLAGGAAALVKAWWLGGDASVWQLTVTRSVTVDTVVVLAALMGVWLVTRG